MLTTLATDTHRSPCGIWRIAAWTLFLGCGLLRLAFVDRHGLWADEFFSLAMATGHSLEHSAAEANPVLGDYVEATSPMPASAYARYLEHEHPPCGPGRVVRAVLRSDTSPPLYHVLLYVWTRALGTGDAALRLLTVLSAVACFPLLWVLARQIGGRVAALPACVLFTFSPLCVFYSTEGRMYALLWFCTLSTMYLTLKIWRRGCRPGLLLCWVTAGAGGLLTHYFFVFVWAAALFWLCLHPGRSCRKWMAAAALVTVVLVLPWYMRLPESVAGWRVTAYWVKQPPPKYIPVVSQVRLPWSFFSLRIAGGMPPIWVDCVNLAVVAATAILIWTQLSWSLFRTRRQLLWLWLMAACLGPLAFDFLRGTYVTTYPRYASAGMFAAFLLLGLGLGRLERRTRAALLTGMVLLALVGDLRLYLNESRSADPTRAVAKLLSERTGPGDVVLVHSIPSGVTGIARYMDSYGAWRSGVSLASWVGQLGQRRVPDDLLRWAAGHRRIVLVKINEVGEPAPEEAWLRDHAVLSGIDGLEGATILYFDLGSAASVGARNLDMGPRGQTKIAKQVSARALLQAPVDARPVLCRGIDAFP